MSDKQKQAVERLYELRSKALISEADFYLFLEFVLEKQVAYSGYSYPTYPYYPWWQVTWQSGEPWNGNSITADKVNPK